MSTKPKVRLKSDFHDYYDHWFDGADAKLTFHRQSNGGMPRRDMLDYLRAMGLRVPVFGRPAEVRDRLRQKYNTLPDEVFNHIQHVVVYLNETAHRGKGKIKVSLRDAVEQHPERLAIEYIPATKGGTGATLRYLQVGDKIFWLKYLSLDDWRSNCGEVEIHVLSQEKDGFHPYIKQPLFAIDFVRGDALYAIDFNIAPGIKGTGVENMLSARDAAEAIKRSIQG